MPNRRADIRYQARQIRLIGGSNSLVSIGLKKMKGLIGAKQEGSRLESRLRLLKAAGEIDKR